MANQKMTFRTILLKAGTPNEHGEVWTKEALQGLCDQLNGSKSPVTNIKKAEVVPRYGTFVLEATIEANINFEF